MLDINHFQFEDGLLVTKGDTVRFRDNFRGMVFEGKVVGFRRRAWVVVKTTEGENMVAGGNILRAGENK